MKKLAGSRGLAAALALAGGAALVPAAHAQTSTPPPATAPSASGLALTWLDPQADPCSDFYRYACGNWVVLNPPPPDRGRWAAFEVLARSNRTTLRQILEADAAGGAAVAADPDRRKLGDFYASCVDEKTVDARGLAPLQPDLDRIAALSGAAGLPALFAELEKKGVDVPLQVRSGQGAHDATQMLTQLGAGGLGLPDRDYYLKTDAKSVSQRESYTAHVQRMFVLLGEPAAKATADAATVLALETALAQATLDKVSLRDPRKRDHEMTPDQLSQLAPGIAWSVFLSGLGVVPAPKLNVMQPDFVKAVEKQVQTASRADWQTYLRWQLVHAAAPWLSAPFVEENHAFYDGILSGTTQMRPRWERCVEQIDREMGDALGREYVAAAFNPAAKQATLTLVGQLEAAMKRDIASLAWMTPETRARADEKLAAIANKIGYPDSWRDYSRLEIRRGDLLGDVERAAAFELARRLQEVGKPVDRKEWGMSAPTVNAYYYPPTNDINFPAGILQPPFYGPQRDDAVNYGGIGAVIGHEMTHGFDDSGSRYDGKGNLDNWWTPADQAEFEKRTQCIADEYSAFPVGDLHVNGRLTLGENTADNGGLRIAYQAYETSHAGRQPEKLDGFTPEQRFFLGFGQLWCSHYTPEAERLQVLTNPHSLGRFRADGTVSNMPEFQQAFHCPAGSPMAPANRCQVW